MVVNLSQKELSSAEVSLLSKGLSSCPTPPRLNSFDLRQDFLDFAHRLRLQEYFYGREDTSDDTNPYRFQRKSGWTPPKKNRDVALKSYIKAVDKDITKAGLQKPKTLR